MKKNKPDFQKEIIDFYSNWNRINNDFVSGIITFREETQQNFDKLGKKLDILAECLQRLADHLQSTNKRMEEGNISFEKRMMNHGYYDQYGNIDISKLEIKIEIDEKTRKKLESLLQTFKNR